MDEQSLNELLECSVCLDRLDLTSKVLPCQHTFCRRCLEEIVSTKGELRCPECRFLVEIRVEDLPSNILLIRLLEGIKTKSCTERSRSPGRYNDEVSTATDKYKQAVGKLPCAKALYNYEGKNGDLSFKKGDILILKKQVDDNWYHGEFNSQHGFFPATYVQILVPLPTNIPQCKTLYDFEMKDESDKKDCLFFKKDETVTILKKVDDNWLEGKKGEKIGIFPVSFVEMNDAAKSLINSQTNLSMHASNLIMHERGSGDGVPNSFPLNSLAAQMPQQKRHSFTATQQKSSPTSHHNRRSLELSSSGNLVIVPSAHLPTRTRSPPPVPTHSNPSATSASKPNTTTTASKPVLSSKTTSKTTSAFQEPTSSRKNDITTDSQPGPAIVDASKISGVNTPVYTALFNYKTQREDEIELRKGDYYTVCDKCQDGWYRGQCLKTGKPGVFPGNYVQMVRLPSAFLPVSGNVMNICSKGTSSLSSSASAPVVTTTSSGHRTSTSPSRPGSSSSQQLPQQSSAPPPITPRSSKSLAKLSSTSSSSYTRTTGASSRSSSARASASVESSSSRTSTNVGQPSSTSRTSTNAGQPSSSSRNSTSSGQKPSSPRSQSGISSSLHASNSSETKTKSPTRHGHKNSSMEGNLDLTVTSAHSSHRSSSSKQVVYRKPNAVGMPQAMSALSNITPPNVVAGATGEIPGVKREKKEKEKLSIMKRLTSGKSKKSKSPGHESDGSGPESNHVRSGSCPADSTGLLGAEGSQHVKTGSFDSTVAIVPQHKPSRPKPLVREKFRCVVPYPPQGQVELELKVGDLVYVHKKREDGWYKGTLQRSGKTGLFPGSFVEHVDS